MIILHPVGIHNPPNSVNQELITGGNICPDCPEGFPGGSVAKNPPANAGDMVQEDPRVSELTPMHHNRSPHTRSSAATEAAAVRSPCTTTESSPHSLN